MRDIQFFGEEGGVVPVIDHAATSTFLNPKDMEKVFKGELEGCYLYSRHTNPTVSAFSQKMAAMAGTEAAYGFASGMAAIACTLEQLLMDGGHLVTSNTIYGGTYALLANIFPKRGIKVTFVDPSHPQNFADAITDETKVVYTETMSNPLLEMSDIKSISKVCKEKDIKLVVDNTFTPMIVNPIELGADIVLYSCTKYISGASDLIAGAVCADQDFINELIDVNTGMAMLYGPVMDPRVAYELYSRLDHLHLRMQAHCNSAAYLANILIENGIEGVIYPGLENHPGHKILSEMKSDDIGFGGMITLDCKSLENATKLAGMLQHEKFGLFAVSLGFSRTLMSCPSASTSSEIPEEKRDEIGLKPGLLRLSIGFTGNDKILADRFLACYKKIMG
jgi:methionine-gamma-lyase